MKQSTASTLAEFNDRFQRIIDSNDSDRQKDLDLARLMSDMEVVFQIPALANEEYKKKNPEVMALYQRISRSRTTI